MDLRFSAQELAFRDEVRAFLRERLPPALAAKVQQGLRLTRDDMARWPGRRVLCRLVCTCWDRC